MSCSSEGVREFGSPVMCWMWASFCWLGRAPTEPFNEMSVCYVYPTGAHRCEVRACVCVCVCQMCVSGVYVRLCMCGRAHWRLWECPHVLSPYLFLFVYKAPAHWHLLLRTQLKTRRVASGGLITDDSLTSPGIYCVCGGPQASRSWYRAGLIHRRLDLLFSCRTGQDRTLQSTSV